MGRRAARPFRRQAQARGRLAAARFAAHALGTLAKRQQPRRQAAFEIHRPAPSS